MVGGTYDLEITDGFNDLTEQFTVLPSISLSDSITNGINGQSGNTMTITGTGFANPGTNALTVNFGSYGSVTATLTSSDSTGDFTATFTVPTVAPGLYTVSVLETGGSSTPATEDYTINPVDHFVVFAPASVTAGQAFGVTVTAIDANGETVLGYSGSVGLTDDSGTLSVSSVGLTNGYGSVSDHITLAGSDIIYASDGTYNGQTSSFNVDPASATQLVVSGFGSAVTAGYAGMVTVTAEDQYGNTDPNYAGTIHLTSSDSQAVFGPDSTLTNGVGTFDATLKTATTNGRITATDTTTSSITGSQTGIAVYADSSGQQFVFDSISYPVTAGVPFTIGVSSEDEYGNPVILCFDSVYLTDDSGTLSYNYGYPIYWNGVSHVSVTDAVVTQSGSDRIHIAGSGPSEQLHR